MDSKLFSHHAISRRDLGLQKRPTYEELVNYIVKDPDTIRYPDRKAKILRNSFELSQLDGIGMMEINRQHEMQILDQERQLLLQRFAQDHNLPINDVMTFIDHHGLHPVRHGEDVEMGVATPQTPQPPPAPAAGATHNHIYNQHHVHNTYNQVHHHHQIIQPINGVPAATAPAPAGQPAPAPPPPQSSSTAVQTEGMNMGGTPDPAQIPVFPRVPARNHEMRGASSSDPLNPLPRPNRSGDYGGHSYHLANLIDPVQPRPAPRPRPSAIPAGIITHPDLPISSDTNEYNLIYHRGLFNSFSDITQRVPPPNREPTTPRFPRIPAEVVAAKIRDFTFARGYHPPETIRGNIRLLPRRTESPDALPPTAPRHVAFFVPRSHIYRQRKIQAVAGQGAEAEARAQRAQMLSHIELDLQQARQLARREKTADHARRMLNASAGATVDPDPGIGLIEQPEPAPEIAPSASGGPAVRRSTYQETLQAHEIKQSRARRRYSAKQPRRTPTPERVPRVETRRKANHFRSRVKKDAEDATARLIASRADRLAELEQERREHTQRRVQARRRGGAGAMAQARPPP